MGATAKVIKLTGNPKNQESAEHIIIFPGGSISVMRTTQNEYWAHVQIKSDEVNDIHGKIKRIRMDCIESDGRDSEYPTSHIEEIQIPNDVNHFAVLVTIDTPNDKEVQIDLNL